MRPTARHLAAFLAALAILVALVAPVLAKEFLQATLDAPIAMDTPPGTEILVGVTVLVPGDDDAMHPVEGSPIHLILAGRDGSTTRAAGVADGEPGHYVMRIVIPSGGARGAEVVMHGTSDLPLMLVEDPFTFGGVTAGTAQVAPPLAPPMKPFPPASAGVAVPVAPSAGLQEPASGTVAPGPAPSPVPGGFPPALAVALAALLAILAIGLVAVVRRSGVGRRVDAQGRTPGA